MSPSIAVFIIWLVQLTPPIYNQKMYKTPPTHLCSLFPVPHCCVHQTLKCVSLCFPYDLKVSVHTTACKHFLLLVTVCTEQHHNPYLDNIGAICLAKATVGECTWSSTCGQRRETWKTNLNLSHKQSSMRYSSANLSNIIGLTCLILLHISCVHLTRCLVLCLHSPVTWAIKEHCTICRTI